MTRSVYFRLVAAVILCLAGIVVGATIKLPAVASAGERLVTPQVAVTCASTGACNSYTNTKSGPGVKSTSNGGNGLVGVTKFKSTGAGNGTAGVWGQDASASGSFDSGVLGTSGSGIGVEGVSTNGYGVMATSQNQSALFVQNTGFADGIQAIAMNNDGVNTSTVNNSTNTGRGRSGIYAHDDSTDGGHLNIGAAGASTNGIGVQGSSADFVGVNAIGGGSAGQDYPALSVVGNANHNLVAACGASGPNPCDSFDALFVVDLLGGIFTKASINADGNVDILGQYQVNGNCVAGCSRPRGGSPAAAVRRYVPTTSIPTTEDFGEAQLVNGVAHVALSPDFANVISAHTGYLVFITPEGDTNGVYVTNKTTSGFTVRENHGGTSSVAFQYRIVAHPFGEQGSRLPKVVSAPTRTEPHAVRAI